MTKIRKSLQYIIIAITAVPVLLYYFYFYIVRYAKHPEKYPIEKRYKAVYKLAKKVMFCFHSKFYTSDIDILEGYTKPCLVVSNHLSDFDPIALIAVSPRPITFVSKKEAFSYPFVGKILKALDAFALDRNDAIGSFNTIKAVVKHLKDETKPPVVIFAEGTRNKEPSKHCLDFHPGSLKMAAMAGVDVLPISLYGTFRGLTMNSYLHHYPIFINCGEPIKAEDVKNKDFNEFAVEVKKSIDAKVDELRTVDKLEIYHQWLTKSRKALETIPDVSVNS